MTQYSENWSGEADGVYPSALTKRWVTTAETTVAAKADADAEGNFTFEQEWSADGRRLNEWTAVNDGNEDDIELLARFKIDTTIVDFQFWMAGRASGAAGSETGYICQIWEGSSNDIGIQFRDADAGTITTIATSAEIIQDYVLGDWIYLRFRINGSAPATLQGKLWLEKSSEGEPADWHLDETDTGHTGTGWNGIGAFDGGSNTEVDYIAGGTNGDTAPLVVNTSTVMRITQQAAKVLHQNDAGEVRISQMGAKVVHQNDAGEVRISQMALKVLHGPPDPLARVSTLTTEVLRQGDPLARVSTQVAEVLRKGDPEARISTLAVEVLRTTTTPVEADHSIPAEWTLTVHSTELEAEGDGLSEGSPLFIEDAADLIAMDLAKHYVLINDIDVSAEDWTPLGAATTNFTGSLDGRGFKVFDLNSTYNTDAFGLFWRMGGTGIIRRLGVATTVGGITGQTSGVYCGVLVGIGNNSYGWLIEDCWVEGKIDTGGDRCGGLIGITNSTGSPDNTLRRNRVAVWLSGTIGSRVGGVTGFSSGTGLTHSDNYFDSDVATTTSQGTGSVGTAKTTTLMQEEATFNNFDFDDTWFIDEGVDYPYLIEVPRPDISLETPVEWAGLLELDYQVPVEWLLEVEPGVESDHQIPIEWVAALELDHQIHIDWSGVLQLDYQVPIEWGLLLSQSFEIPAEWQLIAQASHQIPAEWGQGIDSDHQIPILWDGSFAASSVIHTDWSGNLELDHQVEIEWGGIVTLLPEIPVEWGLELSQDHQIPIAWNKQVRGRKKVPKEHKRKFREEWEFPFEWGGGVVGGGNQVILVEWSGPLTSDQRIHIDWSGIIEVDRQIPAEWGTILPDSDHQIPIGWDRALALDYVVPAEWTGAPGPLYSVHIEWTATLELDRQIPVEWLAALESSHQVPIDWGAVLFPLTADAVIPVEWGAGVASDQEPPIEWTAGLAADYVLPTEWLASMFSDHPVPIEWLASMVADSQLPIEWGGGVTVAIQIPAEWTSGVDADSIIPVEWDIATDPVFADFQIPADWLGGLAADSAIPLEYSLLVRFDNRIPVEWRLEGFQPFTPIDDKQNWQAVCSPVVWTIEESGNSWIADPEVVAQAYPDTTATEADPALTAWVACSSPTEWRADDFCGITWRADPPLLWTAERSQGRWTAEPDPV